MTEEEYEVAMDFLKATMPRPERSVVLSAEDMKAWRQANLAVLADFFGETGIGFYGKDAIVLVGPTALTDVIENVLPDIGAAVETGYYTAFGIVQVTLSDGREISIDPIGRMIQILEQSTPSPRLELVFGFVSDFMGAIEDYTEDPVKDGTGRPLLVSAASVHGPLDYAQVYRFKTSLLSGGVPEPDNLERVALADAVIRNGPYEKMVVPSPDPNAPVAAQGEAWGDDWED